MSLLDRLKVDRADLARLCTEFGVRELSVFGSVLREDFSEASDVDLLVEFQPERRVGLFHLLRLQQRLEDLIGRRVDLIPKDGLKPLIREQVLSSARTVYAA